MSRYHIESEIKICKNIIFYYLERMKILIVFPTSPRVPIIGRITPKNVPYFVKCTLKIFKSCLQSTKDFKKIEICFKKKTITWDPEFP